MNRPLLLSAPEVRAVLREIEAPGTGKRMHRVALPDWLQRQFTDVVGDTILRRHPHQKGTGWEVGDRLWVREGLGRRTASFLGIEATNGVEEAYYLADGEDVVEERGFNLCPWWKGKTLSPASLPRARSRITLHVTEVRVERLQSISEADAEAEGCEWEIWDQALAVRDYRKPDAWLQMWGDDCGGEYVDSEEIWRASFRTLWDHRHGGDAWERNPYVAALTIRPILANIDAPETVAAIPATASGGGMTKEEKP